MRVLAATSITTRPMTDAVVPDARSAIHLIGGEKGGVGKSLVSRLLAQHYIDRGIAFTAFDTDRSYAALMRFHAGYASPVLVG